MAKTYEPIATATLTSAGVFTFNSIPQTFTDLVLYINITGAGSASNLYFQFNGLSTTVYSWTRLDGNGSSLGSSRNSGYGYMAQGYIDNTVPSSFFAQINNYANANTYKQVITTGGGGPGTYAVATLAAGMFSNTAAITSITINSDYGTVNTGSSATLYGIKAA